jgi:hypothetical protein
LPLGLIDSEGGRREVYISPAEHPAALMLPVFAKPRILTLPDEERRETFIMSVMLPNAEVLSLNQRYNAPWVKLGSFEILSFCRLLAKIAHGLAFQDLAWAGTWEPLLPDLILGGTAEYDFLVGGTDRVDPPEEMGITFLFESVDIGEERYLVIEVRLFASQKGTPTYRVVVGKRR